MKKVVNTVVFLLFTYPAGLCIGVVFEFLWGSGILEVRGWENFPKQKGKILLISNHPSLVEPVLLIGVFFHQYVLRPFKYGPWTLADRKNYYDNWKFFLMRPRLIPVDRTKDKGDVRSLVAAKHILEGGANILIFPEGGRTFKGIHHLVSWGGRRLKMIRPLKGGFSVLATGKGVVAVPVWFEFHGWSNMRLTIGKPVCFEGTPREEVVKITQAMLLRLADAS